ncbi:MAG TPA: DUF5668 domain-containing protein [Acidisarcina sp.]
MNHWIQIRRLRGPAFLVLIGIMAMMSEWHILSFHRSWPLLLILAGVLSLAERAAIGRINPDQVYSASPAAYPPYPGAFTEPPYSGVPVQQPHSESAPEQATRETGTPEQGTLEQGTLEQGRS